MAQLPCIGLYKPCINLPFEDCAMYFDHGVTVNLSINMENHVFEPGKQLWFPLVFFGSSGHVTLLLRGLSFVQEITLGSDALTLSDHSLKLLEIVATFPILRQTKKIRRYFQGIGYNSTH